MSLSLSHPKRVLAAPSLFGRVLGLALLYSSWSFKPWFFFCVQRQTNLLTVLRYYLSPLQFTGLGLEGSPSLPYLCFSCCFYLPFSLPFIVKLFSQSSVLLQEGIALKIDVIWYVLWVTILDWNLKHYYLYVSID